MTERERREAILARDAIAWAYFQRHAEKISRATIAAIIEGRPFPDLTANTLAEVRKGPPHD